MSLLTAVELAENLGLPTDEDSFTMFDLYQAEEAMLTASTFCLLPVVKVNVPPLGDGKPGPIVMELLRPWSQLVDVDLVEGSLELNATLVILNRSPRAESPGMIPCGYKLRPLV